MNDLQVLDELHFFRLTAFWNVKIVVKMILSMVSKFIFTNYIYKN